MTHHTLTIITLLASVLAGCGGGGGVPPERPQTECIVKTTPVKDQGKSSLCWAYAMLATIESNHLMMGDSVNLSADYVARKFVEEQARQCYIERGGKGVTTRGMAPMLITLIMRHGLTHHDAYSTDANMNVVCRKANALVRNAAAQRTGIEALSENVAAMLDRDMRPLNRDVYLLGARYTPLEFAHSVCREGEYVAMTSFTHHPFGESFALESRDNRWHEKFLNVPLDSLQACTERSLRGGNAVCWEGDISEPGFSFAKGFAVLGSDEAVTQGARQRDFERFHTTDDHCMEIVGIAHDRQGRKFFICKNSWGSDNPFGGFMYMSEAYFRSKTYCIVVRQESPGEKATSPVAGACL